MGFFAGGALATLGGAAASAQSYTYNYLGTAVGTAGSFTVTNTGGTYNLSQFAGTVNGVSYTTATVGLATGSNGYYYLGALANGIDYFRGANDFTESGAFLPGNGPFSDTFQYYNKSGEASGTSVNFTVPNQSYAYTYTSDDPKRTSGAFTVKEDNGSYTLSSFIGEVNGVSYDTSTVGLAPGGNGSYYLGALANGIDYFTGSNDFSESGAFMPGTGPFNDSFEYYLSPGLAGGISINAVQPGESYSYRFSGGSRTSGTFTVTEANGMFKLSAFDGTVNGVAYTLATVGLAPGSNGTYYLGALANGIDYFSGMSDFTESGTFLPGTQFVSDSFQFYVSPGQAGGTEVTFTPLLRTTNTASVPEPASWAVMLTGLFMIGGWLRRRPAQTALQLI
ncbi:PEP-CTERM sorting domain-containing protein [Sphingomonas bacterium]|uniref:PEP-CTERM sorting domain-containing protein n=1 Tax=Sphingomonas bacterium TaxID=1895847 RepID=UPI0015762640|nr:PEP-CTERM sorting domain-containing protein [Sphingomonas bacterium]